VSGACGATAEAARQKAQLLECLRRTGAVRFGEFTLASGRKSDYYVDKYLFETDPACLRLLGEMVSQRVSSGTDLLAGIELGSIAIAAAAALECGLPFLIVRKAPKGYGTVRQVEGAFRTGQRVLLVEDVTTTGSGILNAVKVLRAAGLVVDRCVCAVDRQEGAEAACAAEAVALDALLTASEILGVRKREAGAT